MSARDDLWRWARRVTEDPYGDLHGDKTENLINAYLDELLSAQADERQAMSDTDYELVANEIAGPDAYRAVQAIALELHAADESILAHGDINDGEPCPSCWLWAGHSLRAMRRFAGHPYFTSIDPKEGTP